MRFLHPSERGAWARSSATGGGATLTKIVAIWVATPERIRGDASRFHAASSVPPLRAAFASGAGGLLQHFQPPQLRTAHELPDFASVRPVDLDARSLARQRRPERRPQSAVSYGLKPQPLSRTVQAAPAQLPGGSLLVPVYHCGARVLNTHRPFDKQQDDWMRVQRTLNALAAREMRT
jgi:hypothetical protein